MAAEQGKEYMVEEGEKTIHTVYVNGTPGVLQKLRCHEEQ